MKRDGFIVAGGILAILRGGFGVLTGLSLSPNTSEIEALVPGFGLLFVFELAVSALVLMVGAYALAQANVPSRGGVIKILGNVIAVAGLVDLIWAASVFGATTEALFSGLGSLVVLALIGGLLYFGGRRLASVDR